MVYYDDALSNVAPLGFRSTAVYMIVDHRLPRAGRKESAVYMSLSDFSHRLSWLALHYVTLWQLEASLLGDGCQSFH